MVSNAYTRARMAVLTELIKTEPEDLLQFFRNGYFPEGYNEQELVKEKLQSGIFSNEPLTMTEKCSFSSFFVLHPEKIAGKEIQTSSKAFPIKVKGSVQDIKRVMSPETPGDILLLEMEAEAVIVALGLGIKI